MQSRKFTSFASASSFFLFCSLRLLFSFATTLCSPTSVSFENLLLVLQFCAADFQTRFLVDPLHHNNSCRYPRHVSMVMCFHALFTIHSIYVAPSLTTIVFLPSFNQAGAGLLFSSVLTLLSTRFLCTVAIAVSPRLSVARTETVSFSPLPMKF